MNVLQDDIRTRYHSGLAAAARHLDRGGAEDALAALQSLPLVPGEGAQRHIALSLWQRALLATMDEGDHGGTAQVLISRACDRIASSLGNETDIWDALGGASVIEKAAGPVSAAALVASVLWPHVLEAPDAVLQIVLELFFRADSLERFDHGWHAFLSQRADFVPGYWTFLLHTKTFGDNDYSVRKNEIRTYLDVTGRGDLEPLFEVYLEMMRQAHADDICSLAEALKSPEHRARIAEAMSGMGFQRSELRVVAGAMPRFVSPESRGLVDYVDLRLANAEKRWSDVIEMTGANSGTGPFRYQAKLLRANALGRTGRMAEACDIVSEVQEADDVPGFLRSRAESIRMTLECIDRDIPLPEDSELPDLPARPGRPLAQSLWVGSRLRWIERLAIRSYLDNGWRFQLYVYEDPEGVPDGCEVLDASAIIPERQVFREGAGSGLHAGSIGAFSDLFRYRLLADRGGMWTDTDVINFRRFDPDGMCFLSSEISDAGLVSPNGALMAAPAGALFMERAFDRASELVQSDDMYFARIGPQLLAEMLADGGLEEISLMPPGFLSPVSWMNTGTLLRPHDEVMARPEMRNVINMHVYTEMWRMLGLGLDRTPSESTFLGHLYAEKFGSCTGRLQVEET